MISSWLKFILVISYVYAGQSASLLNTGDIVPITKLGSKSYYFSNTYQANFIDSNQICRQLGMSLVTIPTKEVNDFLYQTTNTANLAIRFWTAGTNLIDGKNWVWITNASPVSYTNWLPGQPDAPAEKCIELQLQKSKGIFWNNLDCNVALNFICESLDVNEKGEVLPNSWKSAFADPSISPNFPVFNYNQNSYYIGNQAALSYLDASKFCKLIGMELVYIESEEENNALYKYIRDTMAGTTFWTGGSRLIDGVHWLWLPSGRKVIYTSWLVGQPDTKVEHCIQLQFQKDVGLFWNDLTCAVLQNFICKAPTSEIATCPVIDPYCGKPITRPTVNPVITPVPTTKPYFYISQDKANATDAVKKCNAMGLRLVSIQNKNKQLAVSQVVIDNGYADWIWTSGNRAVDENTWVWLSGEPITEFYWKAGEPNNQGGNEEYMLLRKKGDTVEWNDAPGTPLFPYICELPDNNNFNSNGCDQPNVINVYVNNKPHDPIVY